MNEIEDIRVVLADDHPIIRSGISHLLSKADGIKLVGEAANGHDAYHQACDPLLKSDVLLLDLNMPGPSPLETVGMVRNACPNVKLIVLTGHADDAYVRALVGFGVEGYVIKDEGLDDIVQAIHTVAKGGTWFSQPVITKLIRWNTGASKQRGGTHLTDREMDILRLVVNGHTDQEISQKLGLADRTVRYRLRIIYSKLAVKTRVDAAVQAVRLKLVEDRS
jgi:two-component system, NarL family, nitrate/nitrite response regulator NarL